MDRLLPLLAGFHRPAPGRDPKVQVRGEVRGAGSTAHRVRPLQGAAQMADGDAYPRPADPGRAPEPDRIPGRPGVRVGGAAAQDRKSTRLNSSHSQISYAVFCLKKKRRRAAAVT